MKSQTFYTSSLSSKLLALTAFSSIVFAPSWEADSGEVDKGTSAESRVANDSAMPLTQPNPSAAPAQSAMKSVKNTPNNTRKDTAQKFLDSRDFSMLNGWMPTLGKCAPMCAACNLCMGLCCPTGCIGWCLCNYCGEPKSEGGCAKSIGEKCRPTCVKFQLIFGPIQYQDNLKPPVCGDCLEHIQSFTGICCCFNPKSVDPQDRLGLLQVPTAPSMQEMSILS